MQSTELDERRLQRLVEVGRSLVSELDLEVVLNTVLEAARELTGAKYAALGILDDNRKELEQFITVGIDEEERRAIGNLPRGRGVLGLLIRNPEPLRLDNVGAHPRSYGFPAGHPPMSSFLGVPILIRGEGWGNLYLTEKESGTFDETDEQAAVVLADWAAIGIENARLYERLEGRRDELEHAVRGLEATTEISRAIGGQTQLEPILDTVAKRARALIEARTLLILLPDGEELKLAAAAGELDAESEKIALPVEASIPGMVMRAREADRFPELTSSLSSAPHSQGNGTPALLVPLLFRGRSVGVLAALDPLGRRPVFTDDDQRILVALAASAAIAIATAQAVAEDSRRLAVQAAERERARWARELHDESLQQMAGLRLLLANAKRADNEQAERLLTQAEHRTDESIAAMRRLIADLRPAALDEIGLEAALGSLVERVNASETDVKLNVDLAWESGRSASRHVAELEEAMYRIIQEAVNNAIQHARAATITVDVQETDGHVELRVRDDGRGFDPAGQTGGFGLRGMRERAELVGGTLAVETEPGEGTTIRVDVPAYQRRPEVA